MGLYTAHYPPKLPVNCRSHLAKTPPTYIMIIFNTICESMRMAIHLRLHLVNQPPG